MADLKDYQLEVLDDDSILPDEVDPFEGSLLQNDSIPFPRLDAKDKYDILPKYFHLQLPKYSFKSIAHCDPESWNKFPHHIKNKEDMEIQDVVMHHGLCFLPAKSLCRFSTVSKDWHKWIKCPFFGHKQSNHFKHISGLFCQFPGESPSFISLDPVACGVPSPTLNFLPEHVDVRTTCNGLLGCRSCLGDNAYYICNPVTKKWTMLPKPNLYHEPETAIALAFEPDVLKFDACHELICAVILPDRAALRFEIYSSMTNSWRVCDAVCFELDALALNGDGFYFKGFVYWETQSGAALVFDLKEEEYGIVSLPPSSNATGALTEMHGELCYLLPRKEDAECSIEVYGDMDMRLRSVISLNPEVLGNLLNGKCRALAFVNEDTLIVVLGREVIAYHVKTHTMEWLSNARTDGFPKYLPYVNSLVPVDETALDL